MGRIGYWSRYRRSLGDDIVPGSSLDPATSPTIGDPQAQMVLELQGMRADLASKLATEQTQRWMQIAATLAIPLAAAMWRWLLGKHRARRASQADSESDGLEI
jgi:hypothetical protein